MDDELPGVSDRTGPEDETPEDEGLEDRREELGAETTAAFARLRELIEQRGETASWFGMWGPAIAAGKRLATTAVGFVANLGKLATSDATFEPLPPELRAELRAELVELGERFPDAAEILFGLHHLDELIDTAMADEITRAHVRRAGSVVTRAVDAVVAAAIRILLDPGDAGLTPQQVSTYLSSAEQLIQKLLDRWLMPLVLGDETR